MTSRTYLSVRLRRSAAASEIRVHRIAGYVVLHKLEDPLSDIVAVGNIPDAAENERVVGQDEISAFLHSLFNDFGSRVQRKRDRMDLFAGASDQKPHIVPVTRKAFGTQLFEHSDDLF